MPAIDPYQLLNLPTPDAGLEQAPLKILEISRQIDLQNSLAQDDIRFVNTLEARGNSFRRKFLRSLGYDEQTGDFSPLENQHLLFVGHVGCGKSTELTRLTRELEGPERYWVVRADITELLDPNDLKYYEVWLAFAKQVIGSIVVYNEAHPSAPLPLPEAQYGALRDWLNRVVTEQTQLRELTAQLDTSAQIGGALPFLGALLAKFTSSVKAGSTYREIIRTELNKGYSEFIAALNTFLAAVRHAIQTAHLGRGLLLVIDGLDRLKHDDWRDFFVNNVSQLTSVQAHVVYTAPMALKASGDLPNQFRHIVLPMVKLKDFDQGTPIEAGYKALRHLVLLRANYQAFESQTVLDRLIEYSGGHLRGLLQLLSYACIEADGALIDEAAVEQAIKSLASSYRDWLKPAHYALLRQVDDNPINEGLAEDMSALIDRGALLEYNEGSWRQSHPCIRTLPGYKHAKPAP